MKSVSQSINQSNWAIKLKSIRYLISNLTERFKKWHAVFLTKRRMRCLPSLANHSLSKDYLADLSISSFFQACVELQCLLPNVSSCLKTGKPPADGTACGKSKVSFGAACHCTLNFYLR